VVYNRAQPGSLCLDFVGEMPSKAPASGGGTENHSAADPLSARVVDLVAAESPSEATHWSPVQAAITLREALPGGSLTRAHGV